MSKSAPDRGADTGLLRRSDLGVGMPTASGRCWAGDGFAGALTRFGPSLANSRVGLSYADNIDSFPVREGSNTAVTPLSVVFTQSERGLDLAESPPKGGGEARESGKSGAARSDRRETCRGRGGRRGDHALAGGCKDE